MLPFGAPRHGVDPLRARRRVGGQQAPDGVHPRHGQGRVREEPAAVQGPERPAGRAPRELADGQVQQADATGPQVHAAGGGPLAPHLRGGVGRGAPRQARQARQPRVGPRGDGDDAGPAKVEEADARRGVQGLARQCCPA